MKFILAWHRVMIPLLPLLFFVLLVGLPDNRTLGFVLKPHKERCWCLVARSRHSIAAICRFCIKNRNYGLGWIPDIAVNGGQGEV